MKARGPVTERPVSSCNSRRAAVSIGSSIAGARIDAAGSHAGFLVVVVAAACAVVATLAALRTLRGDAAEHVHDSVEAGSPSATGGAAVAACEMAESVDPSKVHGPAA